MQRLTRVLGLPSAVVLGLGSILGTGLFVSLGLAAGVSGYAVPLAIILAATVAMANGMSSASLAANHPVSGGTYEYGYTYLGRPYGFFAGTMFLAAKSASAATAALGLIGYIANLIPAISGFMVNALAAGVVVVLTALVASGLRRSTKATVVSVSITILGIVILVIYAWRAAAGAVSGAGEPAIDAGQTAAGVRSWLRALAENPLGFLQGAALVFVAFTGYGRIATLGEEVKEPSRTIPRAIVTTVAVVTLLYVSVAIVSIGVITPAELATAARENQAPLELVARRAGGMVPLVAVLLAAVTALFGVLLNLILGLSRVVLAMGRRRDLPGFLARIDDRRSSPVAAVVVVGVLVALMALFGSVELNWSFSALTVLVYYALTNLSALFVPSESKRIHPVVSVLGVVGCLALAFAIGPEVIIPGAAVLGFVVVWYILATHFRKGRT